MVLMQPSGDIALQQRNLLIAATLMMLLIVVPVMVATVIIALRYRHDKHATYAPDWDHSTQLELVIWAVPLVIIVAIGAMTWIGTHTLDPYRPIARISATEPLPPDTPVLTIEVVSLDWKWLFIYPDYGIAAINQLAVPVDTPIQFKLTSETVMNSFFVPAMAGQIMVMAGMETKLAGIINEEGDFKGLSANYSGAGFSDMHFRFLGKSPEDFDAWVKQVKSAGSALDRDEYLKLAKPFVIDQVNYYAPVSPDLYHAIVNRCVAPGQMCMHETMMIDAMGGGGLSHEAGHSSGDKDTPAHEARL